MPKGNSWAALNTSLRGLEDEAEVLRLLRAELKGRVRSPYIDRLYGKFSRLRSQRERKALLEKKAPRV